MKNGVFWVVTPCGSCKKLFRNGVGMLTGLEPSIAVSGEWQHQDPTIHRVRPLNSEPRNLQLRREAVVLKVDSVTTTSRQSTAVNDRTSLEQFLLGSTDLLLVRWKHSAVHS
jgi:hypothetical protein